MTVGFAHDPAEHEADAVADRVMRMPEPGFIQRKCAACSDEEKIHRMPAASFIQRAGRGDGFKTSPEIASAIEANRGGGTPLPAPTKSFMESRFGTDFCGVRVHTDGAAVQLSRDLNAQAFTVGNDIFFNSGKFSPESSDGKHLLAHELTHTVQQGGGGRTTQSDNGFINRKHAYAPTDWATVQRKFGDDAVGHQTATAKANAAIPAQAHEQVKAMHRLVKDQKYGFWCGAGNDCDSTKTHCNEVLDELDRACCRHDMDYNYLRLYVSQNSWGDGGVHWFSPEGLVRAQQADFELAKSAAVFKPRDSVGRVASTFIVGFFGGRAALAQSMWPASLLFNLIPGYRSGLSAERTQCEKKKETHK
ncbi:MAG: DUF4157 domain-containing protein [Bacteroidetes bacterium]|nr:DUF4157 domain-containing protein [Bacteroidota bacterium]